MCLLIVDSLSTFFFLLDAERWLAGRRVQSALALGMGGLTKWFPLLLFLPVALRFRRNWREAIIYAGVAVAVVGLVVGLLAVFSPTYTLASLRTLAGRASWETVWALGGGNLRTGNYRGSRLDPAAAALPQGNPARVPVWLTTLVFGGLYLWLWQRTSGAGDARQALRLTTLTMVLFFLWSRGWSPQWLGLLTPLVLLVLPLERAALYLIALTFISIAEWPVLLSRGLFQGLYLTVPVRTVLFLLVLVDIDRRSRVEQKGLMDRQGFLE
jgi:hypothetical protein